MTSQRGGRVSTVDEDSAAWRAGLRPGDLITAVEGEAVRDILDIMWAAQEGWLSLVVCRDGALLELEWELEAMTGLGFTFSEELFDGIHRCRNRCVFCFIDQQPPGLRPSLYVKDEDYRASFLHGNFVTLTNLPDEEIERIIELHLSPLYVSVHATDETVRQQLLGRPQRHALLPLLDELGAAGIRLLAQIVLVPSLNDRAVLAHTLSDLLVRHETIEAVAVVPVGLTKHRTTLPPLARVNRRCARQVLRDIDSHRRQATAVTGRAIVQAADEFYLRARRVLPPTEYYEDFALLENGVGLLRCFLDEVLAAVEQRREALEPRTAPAPATIVTGASAAPFFRRYVLPALQPLDPPRLEVVTVPNRLFGPSVTVTGLLAGQDIAARVQRDDTPRRVLVCADSVTDDPARFLDDMTVDELSRLIDCPVTVVANDGASFCAAVFAER